MNEDEEQNEGMNRRDFILVGVVAAAAAGCQGVGGGSTTGALKTYDAGPAANYAADGVYGNYRDLGFFIIHRGGELEALSAICTHRRCKLLVDADESFYCKCHGSTFDPEGRVTDGPAKRDLPVLKTFTNEAGHLMVIAPA
jgi:Rieske Fe-S protein